MKEPKKDLKGLHGKFGKKQTYLLILAFIALMLLVGYTSYAIFSVHEEKKGTLNIITGQLVSQIKSDALDNNNRITVKGDSTVTFDITLSNLSGTEARVNLFYKDVSTSHGSRDSSPAIGYSTKSKDAPPPEKGYNLSANGSSGSSKVITVVIKNYDNAEKTIEFASNIAFKWEDLSLEYGNYPLTITYNTYEDGSKANVPEFYYNLIPVVYNGTNWVTANFSNKWYDYNNQEWANAVRVSNSSWLKYAFNKDNITVDEADILGFYVWIPRFEYMSTNLGTQYAGGTVNQPGEIKINFIGKDVTTPTNSNYKIHPAFTYNGEQLAGFWVSKFEGQSNRPNIEAIPGGSSSAGEVFEPFSDINQPSNRSVNTIRNSEWNAIAYLSQSKYGKFGNSNYTAANKAIYNNNYLGGDIREGQLNSAVKYLTGCSSGSVNASMSNKCLYTYDQDSYGTGASTTGTIYGVYDMVGGALEYVVNDVKQAIELSETAGWYNGLHSYQSGLPILRGGASYSTQSKVTNPATIFSYDNSFADVTINTSLLQTLSASLKDDLIMMPLTSPHVQQIVDENLTLLKVGYTTRFTFTEKNNI